MNWLSKVFNYKRNINALAVDLASTEDASICSVGDVLDGKTTLHQMLERADVELINAGVILTDCRPVFISQGGQYDCDNHQAPANWKYHRFSIDGTTLYYCKSDAGDQMPFASIFNEETGLCIYDTRDTTPNRGYVTVEIMQHYLNIIGDLAQRISSITRDKLIKSPTE